MRKIWLGVALTLMTSTAVGAAGKLWIVSDRTCPGVHFNTVQEAVDAASDGDVILLRRLLDGRSHAGFTIDAKALTVVAASGGGVGVMGTILIRNLADGQAVLLQGIDDSRPVADLTITNCAGPIWVDDSNHGQVDIRNSWSVLLNRCGIRGGRFVNHALYLESSSVFVYDSTITALGSATGIIGSDGVVCRAATLLLSGSSVTGGMGGVGQSGVMTCTAGFKGGAAISNIQGQVFVLDSVLQGGPGGFGGAHLYGACSSGPQGETSNGAALTYLPGEARSFFTASPVLDGANVPLSFRGVGGDLAFLLVSGWQRHVFVRALSGVVAPELPGLVPFAAVLPSTGMLDTSAPLPLGLTEPGRATVLYDQGLFASVQQIGHLGSAAAWVVLDESHDPFDGCDPTAIYYVDDDAPGDPRPGDPTISDPLEDGSAEHPFDAIQEAIDVSIDGNAIEVLDGVYSGPGNNNLSFSGRSVLLRSRHGAERCILRAGGKIGINTGLDDNGVISGLTIEDASCALLLGPSGSPTVTDCIVRRSTQCGIYLRTAAVAKRCAVTEFVGEGIEIAYGVAARIDACTVVVGSGTGVLSRGAGSEIANSLIAGNRGGFGGLRLLDDTTVRGCTVVDNRAVFAGRGGIVVENSGVVLPAVTVTSCILRDNLDQNGAPSDLVLQKGSATVAWSNVRGGQAAVVLSGGSLVWGSGNIDADPLFLDPIQLDYHLRAESPCIDAGDPSFVPGAGETDFDGEARLTGTAVEIGADERR